MTDPSHVSPDLPSSSMVDIPDDIPEAQRDSSPSSASQLDVKAHSLMPLMPQSSIGWVGVAAIALGTGAIAVWLLQERAIFPTTNQSRLTVRPALRQSLSNTGIPALAALDSEARSLLGHRRYDEASPEALVPIVADGSIKLRESAARKFTEMVSDARSQGVILVPLSGFRSIEQQQYLFFGIKQQTGLRAEERAEVSAPPGYSEHHTGYAIDIGDGQQPETHLEESFENTDAFRWLQENASFYSFELTFDRGASETVSYEPWHWRFVGDTDSLETFYGNNPPVPSDN